MKLTKGEFYDIKDIPEEAINDCTHMGDCDSDVEYWVNKLNISANSKDTREYLKRFGTWDDKELSDHDANIRRLFWIACGDIKENGDFYFGE